MRYLTITVNSEEYLVALCNFENTHDVSMSFDMQKLVNVENKMRNCRFYALMMIYVDI